MAETDQSATKGQPPPNGILFLAMIGGVALFYAYFASNIRGVIGLAEQFQALTPVVEITGNITTIAIQLAIALLVLGYIVKQLFSFGVPNRFARGFLAVIFLWATFFPLHWLRGYFADDIVAHRLATMHGYEFCTDYMGRIERGSKSAISKPFLIFTPSNTECLFVKSVLHYKHQPRFPGLQSFQMPEVFYFPGPKGRWESFEGEAARFIERVGNYGPRPTPELVEALPPDDLELLKQQFTSMTNLERWIILRKGRLAGAGEPPRKIYYPSEGLLDAWSALERIGWVTPTGPLAGTLAELEHEESHWLFTRETAQAYRWVAEAAARDLNAARE
ncbi:MAG: hypothetical protein KI792_13330 [Alphaproteobacteria bacterium]|nr:hypothetical protein [Alphaproteobacteria bacterium SS10]